MRWYNGRPRRSQNPDSEEVFQDCLTKWEESAAHSILARSEQLQQRPYTFAQTNLLLSLFACDKAADHTFRVADKPPRTWVAEGGAHVAVVCEQAGSRITPPAHASTSLCRGFEPDLPRSLEADLQNATVGAHQPSGFRTRKRHCPISCHTG